MTYLAVALGGALGALARYWTYDLFVHITDSKFPFATFTVNVLGSFLIGVVFVMITERADMGPEVRGVVTVGFLGAFTTFSTFSLDTIGLIEQGQLINAFVYVLSSVLLCIIAAWLGLSLARLLF